MKKFARILTVAIVVALLAVCFVLSTSAAEEASTGFSYTDIDGNAVSGSTDFGAALENAQRNTTITMLGDTVYEASKEYAEDGSIIPIATLYAYDANKGGPLTVDLGGHTLTVIQHYKTQTIQLQSQNKLTIKNGTIKVLWADSAKQTDDKAFPLFNLAWGNAQLTLENVNTYTSMLAYAPGGQLDVKLTIEGGTHYSTYGTTDLCGTAFVETRTAMIFSASDATFYIGKNSALLNALSYNAVNAGIDPESVFDFNNCNIVAETVDTNLVRGSNEYTTVKFVNSRIFGSLGEVYTSGENTVIGVTKNNYDVTQPKTEIKDAEAGSIHIGPGCLYATEATVDGVTTQAVFANGNSVTDANGNTVTCPVAVVAPEVAGYTTDVEETLTLDLYLPPASRELVYDTDGNLTSYNFATQTKTTVTYTFQKKENVPVFEYKTSDGASTTYYYGETTLSELLNKAASGSMVKFLYDYELTAHGNEVIATITHGVTIDLNGHTLTVNQVRTQDATSGQSKIQINTTEAVTVTSSSSSRGTIGVKHTDQSSSYPLFMSESGYGINLTISNVISYSGALVAIFNGDKAQINIDNCINHVIYDTTGFSAKGLVIAFDSNTINVTNTTVYMNSYGRLLASSSRSSSKSYPEQLWNFTNCNIIQDAVSSSGAIQPIISYANEHTKIYFNSCNVYGAITPVGSTYDTSSYVVTEFGAAVAGPDDHTVMFDSASYLYSGAEKTEGVVSTKTGEFITATTAKTAEVTVYLLQGDPVFYGFEGTETVKTYTLDTTVSPHNYEITYPDGTTELFEGTLNAACAKAAEAGKGSTVKFLCDVTADGTWNDSELDGGIQCIVIIDEGMTLDLDGRTFELLQGNIDDGGRESIRIKTDEAVTIKNGTIYARTINSNASSTVFQCDKSDYNITLENMKTYAGKLFYSYSGAGVLNITGGEHHAIFQGNNAYGSAFIEFHKGTDFNAKDAKFYLDRYCSVANGYYYETSLIDTVAVSGYDTANAKYTNFDFTFENCDIISKTGNAKIFNYANKATVAAFNNCRIKAQITTPGIHQYSSVTEEMADGAVTFGLGTVYAGTYTDGLVVNAYGTICEQTETTVGIELDTVYNVDVNSTGKYVVGSGTHSFTFTDAIVAGTIVEVYNPSDNAFSEQVVKVGEAITLPTIDTATVTANGYVKMQYTGNWLDADGNIVTDLVAVGDTMSLTPEAKLTAYLTEAKYNLKLMGHFGLSVIIPQTPAEGVTVTSVLKGEETLVKRQTQYDGGVAYDTYIVGYPSATYLTQEFTIVVNMEVTSPEFNAGQPTTVSQTIKGLSAINYITTVLTKTDENGELVYTAAERALMANLLRYSDSVITYNGSTYPEAQKTLYDTYKSLCTTPSDSWKQLLIANGSSTTANTNFEGYVDSITFSIEETKPRIQLSIPYSAAVTAVKFEIPEGYLDTWKNSAEGDVNWGATTVSPNASYDIYYWSNESDGTHRMVWYRDNVWKVVDSAGNWQNSETVDATYVTKYIAQIRPDNLPLVNVDKTMNITLTTDTGNVSGTYSLGTYYKNMKEKYETSNPTLFAEIENFVLYLVAYSQSAAGYRFGPAIDEDGYVDFNTSWGITQQ